MFARRASLDLGVVPVVVVSPDGVGGGRVGCGVWIVVRDSSRRELLRLGNDETSAIVAIERGSKNRVH